MQMEFFSKSNVLHSTMAFRIKVPDLELCVFEDRYMVTWVNLLLSAHCQTSKAFESLKFELDEQKACQAVSAFPPSPSSR